jgi:hypothetical protein
MTRIPKPDTLTEAYEYLIDRVTDIAGGPVPRKAATTWLYVMAVAVAVSGVVIVVRLTVR